MSSDGAMEPIALEPVDALTVTTLVDNVTDSLLSDQGPAKRPSRSAATRMAARFLVGGDTVGTRFEFAAADG
jgi:7,8-dihydropterin-6-yl-methyl-4-(beta-D-ribofuranosyl)aminobenzene 5'-phosphate synthase